MHESVFHCGEAEGRGSSEEVTHTDALRMNVHAAALTDPHVWCSCCGQDPHSVMAQRCGAGQGSAVPYGRHERRPRVPRCESSWADSLYFAVADSGRKLMSCHAELLKCDSTADAAQAREQCRWIEHAATLTGAGPA